VSTANETRDLLAAPADRLVSLQYILAALRRKRRLLAAIAAVGVCLALLMSVALSKPRTATSALLLQFPEGADPQRAISTDVSLLETRAVAEAALKSLRLDRPVATFQSSYRATILSDAVLRITVKGPNGDEAVRRSNALSRAFLQFRKQVYERQLAVIVDVLKEREAGLKTRLASLNDAIAAFDSSSNGSRSAGSATPLGDLLTQRDDLLSEIATAESTIQDHAVATATVVNGSRVIDPGSVVPVSARKTFAVNAASGLVAALALGAGGVVLLAVVTTRLRRRGDIAAALRAPVLLSVGPVVPPSWLRFVPIWKRLEHASEGDLRLVVRHLQSLLTSAATQPPALVVVTIDNVDVAAVTVRALASRLAANHQRVVVVNETGRALPGDLATATRPAGRAAKPKSDVAVVIAALNPAKGAEHLREWASDAVVLVTAGHSTATTLESNAMMIRAAGLRLRSVVLVGCDPDDDSLGAFDSAAPEPPKRPAVPAGRKARARSS
jgi:capsular polysaccharide biosynthesis protein